MHHCEHLVQKRICNTLFYTRLPTGHTHDDIDACFAIIWHYFISFNTIDTFSQFKGGVESAFRQETGMQCFVHQMIVVIPDYKSFYGDCVDPKFADAFTLIDTMHQWKFEAVAIHPTYFPHGVKTSYRAYSSDKVVEFDKKCKDECLHPIGQATGLEPRTLYIAWRPSVDDCIDRQVLLYYVHVCLYIHTSHTMLPRIYMLLLQASRGFISFVVYRIPTQSIFLHRNFQTMHETIFSLA